MVVPKTMATELEFNFQAASLASNECSLILIVIGISQK
jgi:hypothetical protein